MPSRLFSPSFRRTAESSAGRDAGAYNLVAAGVPARLFPAPGSKLRRTPSRVSGDPAKSGQSDKNIANCYKLAPTQAQGKKAHPLFNKRANEFTRFFFRPENAGMHFQK